MLRRGEEQKGGMTTSSVQRPAGGENSLLLPRRRGLRRRLVLHVCDRSAAAAKADAAGNWRRCRGRQGNGCRAAICNAAPQADKRNAQQHAAPSPPPCSGRSRRNSAASSISSSFFCPATKNRCALDR